MMLRKRRLGEQSLPMRRGARPIVAMGKALLAKTHPPSICSAGLPESGRAGLRRAEDEGKHDKVEAAIRAALRRKDRPGVRAIAAKHGVSVNTVQRVAHAR